MVLSDDHKTSLGQATGDTSHLLSHFEEGYVVPSLVNMALESFGASQVCRWFMWSKDRDNSWYADIGRKQAEKIIYRYIARQFGMTV
jgi:hypothetical protein